MNTPNEQPPSGRLTQPPESFATRPIQRKWLIHSAAWGLLLALPFLLTGGRETTTITWNQYVRFLAIASTYVIVFYVNSLYLVQRFIYRRQTTLFLLTNVLLATALVVGTHFLLEAIPATRELGELGKLGNHPPPPPPDDLDHWWRFIRVFLVNIVSYTFITSIAVAFRMTGSWYDNERTRKELERSRSEAELQNLKSQLNPHFLFNTLNNIYSLIAISPDRAQEVVHELSRLLRYVLYESSHTLVPLEKDMEFIRNYVELMRIRLPRHVSLETDIQVHTSSLSVAPLLFITPIENAFKHGVSNNKPSFIRIEIKAHDNQVSCLISNSYFPKSEDDKSGSGIGLSNLRKRLSLLYPGHHHFAHAQKNDTYHCELTITT